MRRVGEGGTAALINLKALKRGGRAKPTRALASHRVATQSVKMGGERHWQTRYVTGRSTPRSGCSEEQPCQTFSVIALRKVAARGISRAYLRSLPFARTGQLRQTCRASPVQGTCMHLSWNTSPTLLEVTPDTWAVQSHGFRPALQTSTLPENLVMSAFPFRHISSTPCSSA